MPDHFIDRGSPIQGIEKTARDNRVPHNIPRKLENLSLPDQRLVRRAGYHPHGPKVDRQMLCKSTGSSAIGKFQTEEDWFQEVQKTPLSYALLRWHDDYQPKGTRDWTVEFGLRIGDKEHLVLDPFTRRVNTTGVTNYDQREPGVYVYDQTLIVNKGIDVNVGTPGSPGARQNLPDVPIGTTALAVGYSATKIFVTGSIVNLAAHANAGDYYPKAYTLAHAITTYTPGTLYHIGIVYDTSGRTLKFYVNGVLASTTSTFTLPANMGFPGEYDAINGKTTSLQRDIVLLNECTVRGGYSSATNVANGGFHNAPVFDHSYGHSGAANDHSMPWCLSPPRGTAMRDLRIWHQELSAAELLASKNSRESAVSVTNLKGQWALDDGGTICRQWDGVPGYGVGQRDITVHSSYPSYVAMVGGLHGLGLRFTDGQYMSISSHHSDKVYRNDWSHWLTGVFEHEPLPDASNTYTHLRSQGKNDFTVQVQIRPLSLQQELTKHNSNSDLLEHTNGGGTAARTDCKMGWGDNAVSAAVGSDRYMLTDGKSAPSDATPVGQYLGHIVGADRAGAVNGLANLQTNRGFDQTIWSVEGQSDYDGLTTDGYQHADGQRERKPVARGLIDPDGKVVFEVRKAYGISDTGNNNPVMLRLKSATTLSPHNTYVITFIQRAIYEYDSSDEIVISESCQFEIWIWNETGAGAKPTSPDSKYVFDAAWTGVTDAFKSCSMRHVSNYDIIVGASEVNSGWDHSISAPLDASGTPRTEGPWKVPQHSMSPWQDQPLFADIGYFRFWATSLNDGAIEGVSGVSLSKTDYNASLIFNLEIEEISGSKVKNKSRYPLFFELGYKGWGTPQGYLDRTADNAGTSMPHYKQEILPGAWMMEDCLGFIGLQDNTYDNKKNDAGDDSEDLYHSTSVNLLAPFQSTLTQAFGLLTAYSDSLYYDAAVDGTYVPVHLQGGGCLNEFVPGEIWRGTSIGDRTILTSRGGLPKVYNGKNLVYAGFKRWSGGIPIVENSPVSGSGGKAGDLVIGEWYGVRVVYFDEHDSIMQVSPVRVIQLTDETSHGKKTAAIRLANIPPHYDPRVTSIRIYRTYGQDTEDLARYVPVFPDSVGSLPNKFIRRFHLYKSDADLLPAPLDTSRTEFPQCQYSASYNGRLFLAGDPIIPDALYFSDAGNPESVDTVEKFRVIEEGSGDKITGLVSMYGSLYVIKVNSIWKVVDVGGNQFQMDRVAKVGAVSDRSIQFLTIPDTGRNAIFFWSQHGPYLYDGSTTQYIGRSIEEQDQAGETHAEYTWLDPKSCITLHDIRRREIIVIHRPKVLISGNRIRSESYSDAVVFNYRSRGWYRYKGLMGTVALSQSFTGGVYTGFFGNVEPSPEGAPTSAEYTSVPAEQPNRGETNVYHAFLGGAGGQLYKWAEGKLDGINSTEVTAGFANPLTLATYSASSKPYVITATITATTLINKSLSDCWLTIHNTTSNLFFTVKIVELRVSGTTATFYVKDVDMSLAAFAFTPAGGDKLYVSQAPVVAEFPWDPLAESPDGMMDDKKISQLITWHEAAWLYKTAKNYDDATVNSYKALTDASGEQKKTIINRSCEAIKLHLMSFALESRLDAYGYVVSTDRRSSMPKG